MVPDASSGRGRRHGSTRSLSQAETRSRPRRHRLPKAPAREAPSCLAWYIARSAALSRAPAAVPPAVRAIPTLTPI